MNEIRIETGSVHSCTEHLGSCSSYALRDTPRDSHVIDNVDDYLSIVQDKTVPLVNIIGVFRTDETIESGVNKQAHILASSPRSLTDKNALVSIEFWLVQYIVK